ncbi:MAG: DUF4440 domain-containing protein [Terriglobia bacterium]
MRPASLRISLVRMIGLALLLALAVSVAPASVTAADPMAPAEVMNTFMDAFHKFDYATCRSLFAHGAIVTITRRRQGGEFQRHQGDALAWIDAVGEQTKPLKDWRWERLDTHTVTAPYGATVVLQYRNTAKTTGGRFTGEGTDVANLVREDGRWKILQYNMFEDFRWTKDETH